MFPPNMIVIVFCTSSDSMYPGNLTRTMVERWRLSARSADSLLPPNSSEKTRIRTSSGAEGGYLGAGGGMAGGGESQLHPLVALVGHAGSRGHHRHGCS